jgi:hypothetical protein
MLSMEGSDFWEIKDGVLYFRDRISVPGDETLRKQILTEAHKRKYTIHQGEVKMN